ncbi:hypothetical protein [Pontibacillus yanchengensis]|uniref:Uncharacterized protein n=1 Tax=Pontibacillus yanchengensis Y32 TaxID=1385514 RepID=A0A0A2T8X5_9BACI|nr:hypothetical protein [Pontibacillus yanchengensis]KGP70833.1 hypothetical protein N782_04165 [Pontibacillus yanchengensis Y32]
MHVLFSFFLLLTTIKWGNWKKLTHHLDTLWYVSSMSLLYLIIVDDYHLWTYESIWLTSKELTLIHSFIVLPSITFLYISHMPRKMLHRSFYTLAWALGSFLFSWMFYKLERLSFHNNYELWMDLPFYVIMYIFISLHRTRPFLIYGLSILIIIFFILFFKVPW